MLNGANTPAQARTDSKIVVLSKEKREELLLKRRMRQIDQKFLPAIIGIASVMIRGMELDIRFKTSRQVHRDWWKTLRVVVTHMQSGRRFKAKGGQGMTINDFTEGETLTVMKPVLPSATLGPDELYRVDIHTMGGQHVHFLANRVRGRANQAERLAEPAAPAATSHRKTERYGQLLEFRRPS